MKQVNESPGREIQGLFSSKDSNGSFWTLRAKVELAVFQESLKIGEKK